MARRMITPPPEDGKIYAMKNGKWVEIDAEEKIRYEDYARMLYSKWGQNAKFPNAWEHSLTVDPLEISEDSLYDSPRGTAQYPNGETEGVIIPNGVTSIGENAFMDWQANNQPLIIPNTVTSIGNYAFGGWFANNNPLVIPNSVTSIGFEAFENWQSNNRPLVIPDSVTSIYQGAFANWESNNQPLVIPNSVTSIGDYAFSGWSSNNQPLVIPNSVTSIGDQAFWGWELVPYVEIQATTPPTLGSKWAFYNQGDAPIYVPDESVAAYKAATNWVDLADRIFSINDK